MTSFDEVGESLVAYGAPLLAWQPHAHMPFEEAIVEGIELAHTNATVLGVLPLILAEHRKGIDRARLSRLARDRGRKAELGMLLELTGELVRDPALKKWADRLGPRDAHHLRYFFGEPRGRFERALVERRTPLAARRWGFLINMPEEAFSAILGKHLATPLHEG